MLEYLKFLFQTLKNSNRVASQDGPNILFQIIEIKKMLLDSPESAKYYLLLGHILTTDYGLKCSNDYSFLAYTRCRPKSVNYSTLITHSFNILKLLKVKTKKLEGFYNIVINSLYYKHYLGQGFIIK